MTHATMRSASRRAAGAVLGVALAASLSACGSDDEGTLVLGGESPSSSPEESPTGGTDPQGGQAPQSPYESEPAVKAVRAWFAAIARDVNKGRMELPSASKLAIGQAREEMPDLMRSDAGLHYPGPLPMTPVGVVEQGKETVVTACAMNNGFATRPGETKPARKKEIQPVKFTVVKQKGGFVVKEIYSSDAACEGVEVEGVRW